MEFHHSVTVVLNSNNGSSQFTISKDHFLSRLKLSARLSQAFPFLVTNVTKKQKFHSTAGGTVSEESGRKHTGIIHHQAVAGFQIINNIVEVLMFDFTSLAVHNQQPGGISLFKWCLRNQRFWKIIPKIMGFHKLPSKSKQLQIFYHSIPYFYSFCNTQT